MDGPGPDGGRPTAGHGADPDVPDDERAVVARLLGRPPSGAFRVVVRRPDGLPAVIENAPWLADGTPMPTRWWLVDPDLRAAVSRLESGGGVRRAAAEVDPAALAGAHARYAAARDAEAARLAAAGAAPAGAARPAGGVGGTRQGVKCLHAHVAHLLAGGDDPVGAWALERLGVDPGRYARASTIDPVTSTPETSTPEPSRPEAGRAVTNTPETSTPEPSRPEAGRAEAGTPEAATPVAAIDCGTNSTRLLVVDGRGTPLLRTMRITRLGEGVDATRRLAPAAIDRTVSVLADYRAEMDRLGVGRARLAATSAVRDAANSADFLDRARVATGTEPEILPGDEEGRLSFAGATARLPGDWPADQPLLVVDIGGGSTELVVGRPDGARPPAAVSVDVGCVRVTERYLPGDPAAPADLARARAAVAAELGRARAALPAVPAGGWVVGLAGTVSTLAMLQGQVASYDRARVHHATLTRAQVDHWLAHLAGEDAAARRGEPGMVEGRVDVIVGGALVLAEVMATFDLARCLVSEDDILDGLAASLLAG